MLVELVLLPRLVKPLALALRGPDELVALGLRTFEVRFNVEGLGFWGFKGWRLWLGL